MLAGNSSASVAFTAPSNTGGGAITSYSVVPSVGGTAATGASSPITVSGLTNGTPYTFQVTAINSYGPGPITTSNSVTPVAPTANFIGVTGGSTTNTPYGIAIDAASSTYLFGAVSVYVDGFVGKYNGEGTLQMQRGIGAGAGTSTVFLAGRVNSSGDIFAAGYTSTITNYGFYIVRLTSAGAITWQRGLSVTAGSFGQDMTIDSSDNSYVVGYAGSSPQYGLVAKWDSSGTLLWQRSIGNATNTYAQSVAVDTSGNVYVVGNRSGSPTAIFLNKYNSSGTLQWSQLFSLDSRGKGVVIDSSGNVIISGWQTTSGYVVKLNSSGAIIWQRKFNASSETNTKVAVDSSDNVYVVDAFFNGTNQLTLSHKWNSAGTLQYQRSFFQSGQNILGSYIAVDSNAVYIIGTCTISSNSMLFSRLPNDGTKTGTYSVSGTNIVYAVATNTESAGSFTVTASGLPDAAGTGTSVTPTLTSTAISKTSSVTIVP